MRSKNSGENRRTRFVNVGQDNTDELVLVAKALGSPMRIQILEFLQDKTANVSEIAQGLGIPRATADLHISVLADAGFLEFETLPAKRGVQKVCTRSHDIVVLHVPKAPSSELLDVVTTDMPIGNLSRSMATTFGVARMSPMPLTINRSGTVSTRTMFSFGK